MLEVLSFRHVLHGLCLRGALDVTTLDGNGTPRGRRRGVGRLGAGGDAAWIGLVGRVGFGSKIWGYTKSPSHVIFDGDNLIMLEVSCFQTNLFVVNEMLYGHRFLTHSQSRTQLDESPKTETCFF